MRKYIVDSSNKSENSSENFEHDSSEFYERWYVKFGKPKYHLMSKDDFLQRLKEMCEFE